MTVVRSRSSTPRRTKTRGTPAGRGGKPAIHWAARLAQAKQAERIVVLDMRGVSGVTDYFVICSGTSTRQVQAIADHIIDGARQRGTRVWHVEGYRDAQWVLLDCGDVVAHVFHPAAREFYNLEQLWGDVPRVAL